MRILCALGWIGLALLAGCAASWRSAEAPAQAAPPTAQQERVYRQMLRAAPLRPGSGHAVTDAEAFRYEQLHTAQLVPGTAIARGGAVAPLRYRPRSDIAGALVNTRLGAMSVDEFVERFPMDGVLIIHRGDIVYERYPRMRADDLHFSASVSKVFVALLVAQLEERGAIDSRRPIDDYVPELAGSGWAGVAVRDILDMASGIADTGLQERAWEEAFWATLMDADAQPPVSTYDFIAAQRADPRTPPGTDFEYSTKNTFALAWLVERVTGKPLATVLAEEIWQRLGAERDAYMGVSRAGAPHTELAMTLRDLGRFGLLYTPSWRRVAQRPVVSPATLAKIQRDGRPWLLKGIEAELNALSFDNEPVSHNGWQWDAVFADGTLFKSGFAGQGLLISPAHDLVVAFYGAWPAMDRQQYNRFQGIARQLIRAGFFD